MTEPEALIPPPPIVRDRLARNLREARLLRRLLRLAVAAAEDTRGLTASERRHEAAPREGSQ